MKVAGIVARIDAGESVTQAELGYLLPELERRRVIVADGVGRCCNKIIARLYRYRGRQFRWLAGHLGTDQVGIVKVPAKAFATTIIPSAPSIAGHTHCRVCGAGCFLILQADNTISPLWTAAPVFGQVAE